MNYTLYVRIGKHIARTHNHSITNTNARHEHNLSRRAANKAQDENGLLQCFESKPRLHKARSNGLEPAASLARGAPPHGYALAVLAPAVPKFPNLRQSPGHVEQSLFSRGPQRRPRPCNWHFLKDAFGLFMDLFRDAGALWTLCTGAARARASAG